ncbi:hypothetical protein ACUNFK_24200 [Serratia sp. IR-2025]|nr:hypothetical protein SME23J_37040 [Serratia marcescens]
MMNVHPLAARCLVLVVLSAGGCTAARKVPAPQVAGSETVSTPAERETGRLALCQRELEALKNIDPDQYERYQTAFSRLMSGVAKYASVRAKVNLTVQDTLDARYRYQVTLFCSDVSQSVMNGLLEREGKSK